MRWTFSLAAIFHVFNLWSNPVNPTIVQGSAEITFSSSQNCFIEAQDKTIINWKDFSIHAGELTRFIQPSENALVLNRVTGKLPSQIMGTLEANGIVLLLNQNGILFGKNSVVDVAGLIASTLNLTDDDFQKYKMLHFEGSSKEAIINHGIIRASSGDVTLLSRHLINDGIIQAKNGNAELVAGIDILLKPHKKNRIFIKPSFDAMKTHSIGIHQKGRIEAIEAHLLSDGNLYEYAIKNEGVLEATRIKKLGNRILLKTDGGKIVETGYLNAPGGEIAVLGEEIYLMDHAHLSTSDAFNPGSIYVGGGEEGLVPSYLTSKLTYVDETVQLEANALDRGNGGKIVCWSDGTTFFGGHAEVKGGAIGGDGGFIEISGKQQIFYRGSTDRFALFGKNGTLSLDPESNFKISTLTNYNVNHLYQLEQPTADIANLSVDTLIGELKKGPVTIKTAFQGEGGTAGHILFDPSASRTYDSPYPLTLLSTGKEGIIWQGSLINTGTGNIELLADLGGISITPLNKDQPALIQTAGNLSLGTSNQPVFGKISIEGAQEQFARVQTIGQGNISIHNNAGVEITSSKNAPATIQFENGNCEIVSADSLSLLGKENSRASIHGSGQLTLAAKNLNVHGDTGAASIQLGGTFHIRHLEEGIQVFAGNNSATIQGNTLLFENIQSDIELFSENAVASISAKDRLWIQNEGTTHLGAYNQKAFIHSDGILEIHTGKDFILYAEKASASIQSKKSLHLHAIHNILLNGSFEGQAVFESPNADIFVGRHLHLFSNSHISTHHGTLFLSVAKNLEMDNPLAIKPPMIQSGKIQLNVGENLHLNDRGSICTTSGKFSASIGHSLYLDDSAQIYAKGGALELTALHGNIHLKRESEIHSETDGTLITAGRSILLEGFSKIKSQEGNGLTLIVDHLHPTSIGEGGLVVASTASLESGNAPLTIYTAKRSLNSIDGTLNGLRLANSPLYLNTKEEQWGAFYPLTSTPSKPPDISPLIALLTAPKEPAAFVVYHKETGLIQSGNQTLSQIIFDQMVVNYIGPFISELFRDLHPYSEYIKNAETFNVIHSENHEKRKVPFSIKRRTFNHRAAIPYKEVNNGL